MRTLKYNNKYKFLNYHNTRLLQTEKTSITVRDCY